MNKVIYLVTGAAGFLGSNVCRQLNEMGRKVRAFVLPRDKGAAYLPKDVEIVSGDLCDVASLEHFFDVPSECEIVVIHCASVVSVNPDYNPLMVKVNVEGTENVIMQCLNHSNFRKLVYVGSTGAIPETSKGVKIKEVSHYDAEKVVGWYSKSKAMASQKVLDSVRTDGLNACIVHPAGIMGPVDYAIGTTTRTLLQIINGEMPLGIQGSFNMCDVRDLARGCILAADKGRKEESYILANEEITLKELLRLTSAEVKCAPIYFYLPLRVAFFMAERMEKKAKKGGKKPLLTTFSVYNLARNNSYDYSKAIKELGYTARPYSETVHDQVQWLKDTGYCKAV